MTGFVAGSIIDFGELNLNPAWTMALPLGAIFFGLSLILFMLEIEMAKFDAEAAKKLQLIRCPPVAPAVKEKSFPNPSLQLLHDH